MPVSNDGLYLGFDLSTQQLKCIVITADLELVGEAKVDFDADLSKYGINKGVLVNPSEMEVYAPPAMWLEALDLVLERLRDTGINMSKIIGLSGAGMQHGVVFWSEHAERLLANLNSAKSLVDQLSPPANQEDGRESAFAHPHSPNWQDASTQQQCDAFDAILGSSQKLAKVTGSSAHHRFSGPQIMRFRSKHPDRYCRTARISLVSSFLASLLIGKIAPIDISDVTGMNLFDIHSRCWHSDLVALTAGSCGVQDLLLKLGDVVQDGGAIIGSIDHYFVEKYGFPAHAKVLSFTGDNPATTLALPLRPGDAIISLGTSTTFLMCTTKYDSDVEYHLMSHPTSPDNFIFMLCYKNGALARERVRDRLNLGDGSWTAFNAAALSAKPLAARGSTMRLGLYFPRPEIVPKVRAGQWRALYDGQAGGIVIIPSDNDDDSASDARQIIESQFLSIRARSQTLMPQHIKDADGKVLPQSPKRIYLVGGGSNNQAIAELCGEILGSLDGIYRLKITNGNACALGAAYKAVWACNRGSTVERFEDFIGQHWDEPSFVEKIADGYRAGVFETYGQAIPGLRALEQVALHDSDATTV